MAAESFLPSRHGFAYTNAWPDQAAIVLHTPFGEIGVGNARGGLCGGMVFAALDHWLAGRAPGLDRPAAGEPLYRYAVDRLIDSWHVPAGVAQLMTPPRTRVPAARRRTQPFLGRGWAGAGRGSGVAGDR